jgi:hypothetical protein
MSPKTVDELAEKGTIVDFVHEKIRTYQQQFAKPEGWKQLMGELEDDEEYVENCFHELCIQQYALDIASLERLALDELFQAARGETRGFGAIAFQDKGQIGAIVYLAVNAMDIEIVSWHVILAGIGFDTTLSIDDASNDIPLAIQYNSTDPQTAQAVLEWLLSCDKYRSSTLICGPMSEISHLSAFNFDLGTRGKKWRRLVLEKLALSANQQKAVSAVCGTSGLGRHNST